METVQCSLGLTTFLGGVVRYSSLFIWYFILLSGLSYGLPSCLNYIPSLVVWPDYHHVFVRQFFPFSSGWLTQFKISCNSSVGYFLLTSLQPLPQPFWNENILIILNCQLFFPLHYSRMDLFLSNRNSCYVPKKH